MATVVFRNLSIQYVHGRTFSSAKGSQAVHTYRPLFRVPQCTVSCCRAGRGAHAAFSHGERLQPCTPVLQPRDQALLRDYTRCSPGIVICIVSGSYQLFCSMLLCLSCCDVLVIFWASVAVEDTCMVRKCRKLIGISYSTSLGAGRYFGTTPRVIPSGSFLRYSVLIAKRYRGGQGSGGVLLITDHHFLFHKPRNQAPTLGRCQL